MRRVSRLLVAAAAAAVLLAASSVQAARHHTHGDTYENVNVAGQYMQWKLAYTSIQAFMLQMGWLLTVELSCSCALPLGSALLQCRKACPPQWLVATSPPCSRRRTRR